MKMNIELEELRTRILYQYYCEKKKELLSIKQETEEQINKICRQFRCDSCPQLDICKETGGFKELDE